MDNQTVFHLISDISNQLDYNNKDFKKLCLKYGTEEIYKIILERLK